MAAEEATACDACLRRSWLVQRLAGHLERARERGRDLPLVLGLPDDDLLAALGGGQRAEIDNEVAAFVPKELRERTAAAGLAAVCRCHSDYPAALRAQPDAPAVLYVVGEIDRLTTALAAGPPVALVGARRASPYGLDMARRLGRDLAAAGIPVVSGMALGVDAAAHGGALDAGGPTVAVLASGADVPYPARERPLYRRIAEHGAVISEMPPGSPVWRWAFPARNRIIAGLAVLTVIVEGSERSGSLITAGIAQDLGREVGAVPGRVTSPQAAGPNSLIADGALTVRHVQDVLDALYGPGRAPTPPPKPRPDLPEDLATILDAVAAGHDTVPKLVATGIPVEATLAGLAELELLGHIRRTAGGAFSLAL